jgi:hypothetical protein
VHAKADSPNKRVLQKMGQFARGTGAAFRVVQLLPKAHEPERTDSGHGSGHRGSSMERSRIARKRLKQSAICAKISQIKEGCLEEQPRLLNP